MKYFVLDFYKDFDSDPVIESILLSEITSETVPRLVLYNESNLKCDRMFLNGYTASLSQRVS